MSCDFVLGGLSGRPASWSNDKEEDVVRVYFAEIFWSALAVLLFFFSFFEMWVVERVKLCIISSIKRIHSSY